MRKARLGKLPLLWLFALALLAVALPGPLSAAPGVQGDEFWDDHFGATGVEGKVLVAAVAPNGDLYVGGDFAIAGGVEANHIARWDGRRWHALGAGLDDWPRAIAIDGDNVYVAGDFALAGDVNAGKIARWDGAAWSPVGSGEGAFDDYFGTLQPGRIYALLVADGGLYAGGDFVSMDGAPANNVAFWNGQQWSALGRGMGRLDFEDKFAPEATVLALAHDGDKLYAGGNFGIAGEVDANAIAAWDGANWSALGGGLTLRDESSVAHATATALAVLNGEVYVGGDFGRAGDQLASRLAAWDGAAWSEVGGGVTIEQFSSDYGVHALAVSGNDLLVGGTFISAGGKTLKLLGRWDGAQWSALGAGMADEYGFDSVLALAAAPEGQVYIGGSYKFAGDLRLDNIGLWDGAAWNALGMGLADNPYDDMPAKTYAIAVDGQGRVYAGGLYGVAGGRQVTNLALWGGGAWQEIGAANDRVDALAAIGDDLFVGGEFTAVGGVAANHVARWNRITQEWMALGSGMNGSVYALAYDDGLLYAGGNFTAAGNVTAYDVAIWDGAQWLPFGAQARVYERGSEGGEIGTYVNALAVVGDQVFIGGRFQTIQYGFDTTDLSSFVVVHNLVTWNSQRDEWDWVGTPLNPGVTDNNSSNFSVQVNDLAVIGDMLYVAGSFNQAGVISAGNLARYNLVTGEWSAPNSGVGGVDDPQVHGLAAFATDLYVAGEFTSAGPAPARFVARLDTVTDQWHELGGGLAWYNDRVTKAFSVAAAPSGIYFGGEFTMAGNKPSMGIARWGGPLAAGNVTQDAGGVVNGPAGLTVQFPAGAAAVDLVVNLADLSAPRHPLPDNLRGVRYFSGAATTLTGQPVTNFLQSYVLRAPFTGDELAAQGIRDPASLNVVYWNGAAWTPMLPCAGCGVDAANRLVTIVADHFAEFALVGPAQQSDPQLAVQLYLPLITR